MFFLENFIIMKINVSVVVPIYNVEKYIGKLIESLIQQTLKEIEIILVDDGSSDKSGIICDQYAQNDNRINVIHKINGGVSAARNDGLELAKGEYVVFCDSDDWLPLDALEKLYNEGERTGADVVIGDVYRYEKGENVYAQFYEKSFVTEDKCFINEMIKADFYNTYCPMPAKSGPAFGYGGPWNKAVRREMLRKNNILFDVRVKGIFDDLIYTAYILAAANKISYITEPVYYYRILPYSITKTYKPNALEINKAIFNCWNEFLSKYGLEHDLHKAFSANVIRRYIEILPLYFFSQKNTKPLKDVLVEMKAVLNTEPYRSAIKDVEPNKLTRIHRIQYYAMSLNSPMLLWMMFKVKAFLKVVMR